jgi:hypothetical protein
MLWTFASIIFMIFSLYFARQLAKIWAVIDMIQFFSFMVYLNMDIPFNIFQFFKLFDLRRFAFLPNFTKVILEMFRIEFVYSPAPAGFLKGGRTTFFLLNNAVLLSAFLLS